MAVYKRSWSTKRGRKHAWIVDYFSQDVDSGKLVRTRETFDRKDEADARWGEVNPKFRRGRISAEARKTTVPDAAEIWLDAVATNTKRSTRRKNRSSESSTVRQYRGHVVNHIKPYFGPPRLSKPMKLAEVTESVVHDFIDHLMQKLEYATARKVFVSFKSILREMTARSLLVRNPADTITMAGDDGEREEEEVFVPEKADVRAILTTLNEKAAHPSKRHPTAWLRYKALIYTAIDSGLRASEIRGLPWANVDFASGTIKVTQRADEDGVIGPPKSAKSKRTVHVPVRLINILRVWRRKQTGEPELVFGTGNDKPERQANIYKRAWHPLLMQAGVTKEKIDKQSGEIVRSKDGKPVLAPRFRFHDLRHFFASMLIDTGANPKEVQAAMGHSSIKVTYDLYGGLFKDEKADNERKKRAEKMARSLGVA